MDIYYQREMATLKELHHPNVVQLLGLCKHNETLFIITEFVEGGDLRRHLKNKNLKLTWALRVKIATDCAAAMAYLHRKSILHRDFKSKNLLVGPEWRVKVCDFGFARKIAPKNEYMTLCGTDEWMAPEVMLGEKYDEKADVYSFGMVMIEIITRNKPLERPNASTPYDYEKLKNMTPPTCPYELFKICILCSQFYPINRPTVFEALDMLKALNKSMADEDFYVKTINDIQAEMARLAQEEEQSSSDAGSDGKSSASGDESNSDDGSSVDGDADDERLVTKLEQVKEVEERKEEPMEVQAPVKLEVPKVVKTPQKAQLGSLRYVRALQDYPDGEEVKVGEGDLTFKKGDEIVFGSSDDSGWIFGTLNGNSGWFPRRCVEEVPLEGAGPLFRELDEEGVVASPIKIEEAAKNVEFGLLNRSPQAALQERGIMPETNTKKDKKLALNMLFNRKEKKQSDLVAEDVSIKEEYLDAIILQMADEESGVVWSKGKKMLTIRSYDMVCQGSALVTWVLDKGLVNEEKEAILLIEYLLARQVLTDPAKNKKAFEKGTMYQLSLLMNDKGILNNSKTWPMPVTEDPLDLIKGLAKRFGMFFKPAPKSLEALSKDSKFRAVALQACELQNVNLSELSTKSKLVFFVNLHNIICMHARAVYGAPKNMLERKRNMEQASYIVAGHVFTAQIIVDKILLGKLEASDAMYPLVSKVPDALSLLGLSDMTKSSPRPRLFSEKTWSEDVRSNLKAWLSTKDVIDYETTVNTIRLPRFFKVYCEMFGGEEAMISTLLDYLPANCKTMIKGIKSAGGTLDIQYDNYTFNSW